MTPCSLVLLLQSVEDILLHCNVRSVNRNVWALIVFLCFQIQILDMYDISDTSSLSVFRYKWKAKEG